MSFDAYRCENGHMTYPGHTVCPECGAAQTETVDLENETGTLVTWTTSTATPPGVREPNHLGIVEFAVDGETVRALGQLTTVDGETVRALGQLTTGDVESGDAMTPVYCEELRDPEAGIREPESQTWDGYRFEPVEED
ncbi:Zn-ribbon domain-containing OB-fold protein [Halarchaeum salinum]|uniref:Zn-ribbon domain-containing OB-fold protein n=1 Tax=Halarchaeum salinum TaxID=489912 RepID=A0AAV3S8Q2_9EURY